MARPGRVGSNPDQRGAVLRSGRQAACRKRPTCRPPPANPASGLGELGRLYALTIVGSDASMPNNVVRHVSLTAAHGAYADQIRRKLQDSTDAKLLASAGLRLGLRIRASGQGDARDSRRDRPRPCGRPGRNTWSGRSSWIRRSPRRRRSSMDSGAANGASAYWQVSRAYRKKRCRRRSPRFRKPNDSTFFGN